MAEVAVVVPVRDGAETIAAAVRSALEQERVEVEVVVVDDGSTDATREILAGEPDPRLRVISQTPAGVAAARNRGVRETSAPLVAFLDADDLWLPEKLADQRAALARRPAAVAAYCWVDYADPSGRRIGRGGRPCFEGDVLPALLVRDFLECASNPVVRRRALAAVGGFDERLSGAADWDLLLRLAERGPFACAPRVGVLYRVGAASMSTAVARQEAECAAVLDAAFARARRARRPGLDPGRLARLRSRSRGELAAYLAFKALDGGDLGAARSQAARALAADPLLPLRRPRRALSLGAAFARRLLERE